MLDPQHTDLLRGLSAPELDLVLPMLQRQVFPAGSTILSWGDPGDCLYIVESGLVWVGLPDPSGVDTVLAHLGPGQIFGEMALLTGQPRTAEVRAIVDTAVYSLSISSFFRAAGRSPAMLLNIARVLAGRLGHMTRATTATARRAVAMLIGPVQPMLGSQIGTNLAAALALVSGQSTLLLDVPAPQAGPLAGREWSPDLDQIRGGEETLAHLARLQVGPLNLQVVNLPRDGGAALGGPEGVTRAVARLGRVADMQVINLCGAPRGLAERLAPLATNLFLVLASGQLGDRELPAWLARFRQAAGQNVKLGVIVFSDDGASAGAQRERVKRATGLTHCLVLPSQSQMVQDAGQIEQPMTLRAPRHGVSRDLTRLAREVAGRRVGLALGSGAAKGVAHVGVLAALDRIGVPIDTVAGTSIGALVGVGVALGMDRHQIAETMDRLVDLWGQALQPVIPRFSLISDRGLERIVHELAGDVRFEELALPFGTVATDMNSGRAVYMRRGPVSLAVRASISIPLIFPPVMVGELALVDGFVHNPVPTQFAALLGADVILASSLSRPPEGAEQTPMEFDDQAQTSAGRKSGPGNLLETYMRCSEIMMSGRGEHDCLSANLTFHPKLPPMSWKEFQKGGVPMQAGERAVEEQLGVLRDLLPWLKVPL